VLVAAAAALCVPVNGWRAALLIFSAQNDLHVPFLPGDVEHALVGVVAFAVQMGVLVVLSRRFASFAVGRQEPPPPGSANGMIRGPDGRRRRRAWSGVWTPVAIVAAAFAPMLPGRTHAPLSARPFRGWPSHWGGEALKPLPATALDRRWAAAAPGPMGRFSMADGSELLLRWVAAPTRRVHPAEDCYRGNGYRVEPLGPTRRMAAEIREPVLWGRFEARRGAERVEVASVIVSESGQTYSDPGWWWWRVAGPGAVDRGPWWFATVQQR
jgi:hypothetical protein